EDQASIVDAVSGCCLLARREVVESIGPLDEEMFGFGEDLDWCVRASKAGWEVWYYPSSIIVHLKGQGGAHSHPYRKIRGMHQCIWLFYKKPLRHCYCSVIPPLVALGIAGSFTLQTAVTWTRRSLSRRLS